jgi:hypothetical protein
LTRIESEVFSFSSPQSILIPPTILFIASDAVYIASQISHLDTDSCPELNRWRDLKKSDIEIDFRRIEKLNFGRACLRDYVVNVSTFEDRSVIGDSAEVLNEISHRIDDELLIFMKSIRLSESIQKSAIENAIENLINLRHPCITSPISFIFPNESSSRKELKIVRMYFKGCSLSTVLSVGPTGWASAVRAKVVPGIVLALRFAHSHGLLHHGLTAKNILFDFDHCIQIFDFEPILLGVGERENESESESESGEGIQLGGFSGEG